ncbi:MAG: DUF2163 domain-containing protein [Caenibius sp.]
MSRIFHQTELEPLATFWRIYRSDGATFGFTAHDRDLWFDGVLHRAAPGMVPSAIRRTAGLDDDNADVEGALSHDAIAASDLAAGRFDGATVLIGVIDWETLEHATLYRGEIGSVAEETNGFSAELRSAKARLDFDTVPRTSPTCRALFCGPGCTLPATRYTHEHALLTVDTETNRVSFAGVGDHTPFASGYLRWIDGPQAGVSMLVMSADTTGLVVDIPLDATIQAGTLAELREGCDHTIATCTARFANAANFQGEPFLPGNDLLARYGVPAAA